ncbi:MAG TPA: CDP-glucose 4,6-dehydratase [Victivallis vadensis]|nr:CDP-glucose 4,6-dehydratase [Victivallis vadensis]
MFGGIYEGRRVLVTGHSGFKGSWLAAWLVRLGARVCGVSLRPTFAPNHYSLLELPVESEWTNIREAAELRSILMDFKPEAVFHLAAQALVRVSYEEPALTVATNVMGTVNLLEACRAVKSVKSLVVVTSDKCYENRETMRPYQEEDAMGGFDLYSASKGCAELVTQAYRRSFFNPEEYGAKHSTLIATARAGNVIGGGDWAADRLVPDLVRAAAQRRTEELRNPDAVRPWQHVLEPLSGYLELGRRLLEGRAEFAQAWNFGPADGAMTVAEAAAEMSRVWPAVKFQAKPRPDAPHEAKLLLLDSTKAREQLGWRCVWDTPAAIRRTAEWYRDFYQLNAVNTTGDLDAYCECAEKEGLAWTK